MATALFLWGDLLRDQHVVLYSDSLSVVLVWQNGSCRDKLSMRILRSVFFFLASRNVRVVLQHVSGLCNTKADALSRFQVDTFRRLHPLADVEATVVPASVWAGFAGCDGSI